MANLTVTIDGPAASGKSTIAKLLAEKLQASFLDTGAMYRAVTLAAMQAGVDMSDEHKLLDVLNKSAFEFSADNNVMTVKIDDVDVTEAIRKPQVTANSRYIASAAKLRTELVRMQRKFAADMEKIVTEGRDQGTVAFHDADIKFYLTADVAERARRRQAQLQSEGCVEKLDTIREAMADCVPTPVHQANGRYILPGAVIDGDQYYLYPGASIIMIEPILVWSVTPDLVSLPTGC